MKTPLHHLASSAILVVLASALATGCSPDATCETSALCEEGTFCFEGECVASLPAGSFTPPGSRSIQLVTPYSPTASTCPSTAPSTAGPIRSIPPERVQDLPLATVGDTVTFDVPANTASVTVHIQAKSAATSVDFNDGAWAWNFVIPAKVELPNGDQLFEYLDALTTPKEPTLASSYLYPNSWTTSFMVPSTHRLTDVALAQGSLPAGTWRLTLSDYQSGCGVFGGCSYKAPGEYRVTVVTKPGPYVASGALNVAVYFVSGPAAVGGEVTAQAASTDPAYQRFVNGIDRLLGQAGIVVNAVRFFEIPDAVASDLFTTDIAGAPPCNDMAKLFSLARPTTLDDAGLDGVRLFLVDALIDTSPRSSGSVVGLTGSIPGPTGLPGAVTSGIVMPLADINLDRIKPTGTGVEGPCQPPGASLDLYCNADFFAYVAAHEIGHWLGLFHPTESMGELYDPLSDTPTCSCESCGPWGCVIPEDAGLAASMCADAAGPCRGADNLMFWQVDERYSRGSFTHEQEVVMLANPAVRSTP